MSDYDIVDSCDRNGQPRTDALTTGLRQQPLMEGHAWHGWAGLTEAGWLMVVAGPTRHSAMAQVWDLDYRWSWVSEPSDGERERRLSQEAIEGRSRAART